MFPPFLPLVLRLSLSAVTPPTASPEYTLTFNAEDIRRVHVEARLPLVNDTVRMSAAFASQLPRGWATFVHDLHGSDSAGPVTLTELPHGRWAVQGRRPGMLALSYDVIVAHDTVRWNVSGPAAAGYAVDRALFFVGNR